MNPAPSPDLIQQMLHVYETGGWVMPALAAVALISYVAAANLMACLYHRGLTKVTDDDIKSWLEDPSKAPKSLRELIHYTRDNVHSLKEIEGRFREVEAAQVPEIDRRLQFLNVMVISAPLFGLLGTVLGMLLTFKAIGVGGSSTSEIIAKGISEALTATQSGMMVAIPGLLMAFVVKRWRNEYVAFLARLEGVTLRYFRPSFHGMTRMFKRKDFKKGVPSKSQPGSPAQSPDTETDTPNLLPEGSTT